MTWREGRVTGRQGPRLTNTNAHQAPVDGTATPIIQSRVAKGISSDSLHPSVPLGRIGNTRYLKSAVLSWTCTVHCLCARVRVCLPRQVPVWVCICWARSATSISWLVPHTLPHTHSHTH